jgi:phosphohistidine phosphatase
MTLRLYLLRHAKSPWKTGEVDFDRPLSKRGRKDAEAIAELIIERGYRPALILCSAARRARETLPPLLSRLDGEAEVVFTRLIYEADAAALLDLIRRSGSAPSLMVVGHNPTLSDLALDLAGSAEGRARLSGGMAPATLAAFELDTDTWDRIAPGTGGLLDLFVPGKR